MLDIAPSELLLVAVVALVVIGPKDLPKALRVLGYWVGRARGVARQFRAGFDEMVREAELADMEKKWAAENARILAEHGSGSDAPTGGEADTTSSDDAASSPAHDDPLTRPVMVEKPVVRPAPAGSHPAADATADS